MNAVIAALPSLIKAKVDEDVYRMYTAECMRIITENTAKYAGGGIITAKYSDIVNPKQKDARSGEQIASDVIKKAGLKVVNK